jgi:hypothetical protein
MDLRTRLVEFYRKLPIVREIRQIRDAVLVMKEDTRKIASKELIEFQQFTVLRDPRYADPKRLLRFAHQTYSQNGEDGMIAEVLRRIGAPSRTFLEIGVGYGLENNTTALLSDGWSGWWIDAKEANMRSVASIFRKQIASRQLATLTAAVTAENIEALLERLGVSKEPDVFSLDIDMNTYWAWAAMKTYKPRLAVIEYNAAFPPTVDWKVDYRAERVWKGTSIYGASLKAMELLGRDLGYSLVGCDFNGVNAFFVRSDLCGDKFCEPFTAENHYEPSRFGLISRFTHPAGFDS